MLKIAYKAQAGIAPTSSGHEPDVFLLNHCAVYYNSKHLVGNVKCKFNILSLLTKKPPFRALKPLKGPTRPTLQGFYLKI